jgi:hypothetical protein
MKELLRPLVKSKACGGEGKSQPGLNNKVKRDANFASFVSFVNFRELCELRELLGAYETEPTHRFAFGWFAIGSRLL